MTEFSNLCPVHPDAELVYEGTSDIFGVKLNHIICKKCGTGLVDKKSDDLVEIIEQYYKNIFWDCHQKRKNSKIHSYISEVLGIKYDNAFSYWLYFKDFVGPDALIGEIGSGAGNLLVFLERKGYNVIGIEPDNCFVELVNSRLKKGKVIEGFNADLPGEEYDAIIATHVLEHLIDPVKFLKDIRKKLKKDGIIFLEVPNCRNVSIMKTSIDNPHLWHFTPEGLKGIITKIGFKVLREGTFSSKHDFYYYSKNMPYLFHYIKCRIYQFKWIMFRKDHYYADRNGAVYRIVVSL